MDFVAIDDLNRVLTKRRPTIADTLRYLEHKGYCGSINFSQTDNVFFGKLENISALVNYETETIEQLEAAFREAVDDYLDT